MASNAENDRPQRWRKKPVVIEAWRLTFLNRCDVAEWCGGWAEHPAISGTVYAPGLLSIETLEGKMWAAEGDYVIRGVKGEFYPCKPDIFEATYEAEHSDGYQDREPQPTDGPEYHADHQAWVERQAAQIDGSPHDD